MFSQKVQSIESQIQQLTEQLTAFRTLESELADAVEAIARIKEAAQKFDAETEDEVSQALVAAVGLQQEATPVEQVTAPAAETVTSVKEHSDDWGDEAPSSASLGLSDPAPAQRNDYSLDDLVQVSSGKVGRISYIGEMQGEKMLTVLVPGGAANFCASSCKLVAKVGVEHNSGLNTKTLSYAQTQELGRDILKLRTWSMIRAVLFDLDVASRLEALKEAAFQARTKTEKSLIENLPTLIAQYCTHKNDKTDISWLPKTVARRVEELLGLVAAA